MASWSELVAELQKTPVPARGQWITDHLIAGVNELATLTGKHVIVYGSAFLQKNNIPGVFVSVTHEDINGFLAALHNVKQCDKGLLLVLHTPGGSAEAAQAIVEYLRSKFEHVTVLVPTYAMSAGTMIALSADEIVMAKHSQLGPTDPQIIMENRQFSAHSIVEQFDEAKSQIIANPETARAWAPVLQPFGPALLQEARKALSYGETLVKSWLEEHMLKGQDRAAERAATIAKHFSGAHHNSHGRRIDRNEARDNGLTVHNLEEPQELQEAALSLYHMLTILFDNSPATKVVLSSNGSVWVRNLNMMPAPRPPGVGP